MSKKNILIVGSNGMVGQDLVRLFEQDKNNNYNIICCNSKDFQEKTYNIGIYHVIFNCSNESVSKLLVNKLNDSILYIDNSSFLRMNSNIPLVIPEVNMVNSYIYANPNCVTIILCLFLNAVKEFKPKNIEVSTYQSLSGAGKDKFKNFVNDSVITSSKIDMLRPKCNINNNKLAFNFYPHESFKDVNGFSSEENKVINETKKITGYNVFPTCIRIPAIRCHGETVTCEFDVNVTKDKIIKFLIQKDIIYKENPSALDAEMSNKIVVGHIRKSPFNNKWSFFLVGDQLTRGAAYNAYKIFKKLK